MIIDGVLSEIWKVLFERFNLTADRFACWKIQISIPWAHLKMSFNYEFYEYFFGRFNSIVQTQFLLLF